jgi:NACalpha-BTF3-like transcription factor
MALSRKSKKAAIHPTAEPTQKEEVKRQPSGEDAQLLMEKTEVPGDDTAKNAN